MVQVTHTVPLQTQKSFPGSLPLRSLCVVFASALHLHSVFTELTTQLEFQGWVAMVTGMVKPTLKDINWIIC